MKKEGFVQGSKRREECINYKEECMENKRLNFLDRVIALSDA